MKFSLNSSLGSTDVKDSGCQVILPLLSLKMDLILFTLTYTTQCDFKLYNEAA